MPPMQRTVHIPDELQKKLDDSYWNNTWLVAEIESGDDEKDLMRLAQTHAKRQKKKISYRHVERSGIPYLYIIMCDSPPSRRQK